VQLERISAQFAERSLFLAEMALDPPSATSDLSGEPCLDEDYLVLSTVHSAKGQEWEAVHILNVADGNFPSEFSTGRPELVEEERRLLYVAMTRAKSELHLVAPLKYYVASQSRMGDRHVYGAKSRFMTRAVLACMQAEVFGDTSPGEALVAAKGSVDVAARLRGMWS
jgi:DNA helicase II / ATP-dependent DNA helicase PcrA